MKVHNTDIYRLLVDARIISEMTLPTLENFRQKWQLSKFHAVLATNIVPEHKLAECLAVHLQLDYVQRFAASDFSPGVFAHIPFADARRCQCLPMRFVDSTAKKLQVVFADPTDAKAIATITGLAGLEIEVSVAALTDIINAVSTFYPVDKQLKSLVSQA